MDPINLDGVGEARGGGGREYRRDHMTNAKHGDMYTSHHLRKKQCAHTRGREGERGEGSPSHIVPAVKRGREGK